MQSARSWACGFACIVVVMLTPVPTFASAIGVGEATLSWLVWQDANGNQAPDPGEELSNDGVTNDWYLPYYHSRHDADGSSASHWDEEQTAGPVAGFYLSNQGAQGSCTGDMSATGSADGSGVTVRAMADGIGGIPGNLTEYSQSGPQGRVWGFRLPDGYYPDPSTYDPAYLTVTMDRYDLSHTGNAGSSLQIWLYGTGSYTDPDDGFVFVDFYSNPLFSGFSNSAGQDVVLVDALQLAPAYHAPGDTYLNDLAWHLEIGLLSWAEVEGSDDPGPEVIPEPTTLALLGLGLAAVARRRRRAR